MGETMAVMSTSWVEVGAEEFGTSMLSSMESGAVGGFMDGYVGSVKWIGLSRKF